MRIKVITKDHGEFISDELSIEHENLLTLIDAASKGENSNLRFDYNGGKIFLTEEVLKTCVFIVMKD